VLVAGGLGYSVVEPFAGRFINAGLAEQNMTALAPEGYHGFTYSIANFPTCRCACYNRN